MKFSGSIKLKAIEKCLGNSWICFLFFFCFFATKGLDLG